MNKVIEFADNVLKHGRDNYRENPTPLFVDGIDTFTGEHIKWKLKGGKEAVISNMACQQNLFRTLTALTNLTGDKRYKDAAKASIKYHFDNLADPGGLLRWGGHCFINLAILETTGVESKSVVHEMKNTFPYYDLMYEVDPAATEKFIKAFWNAHIYDWDELYMGRHGEYGLPLGDVWNHELVTRPAFRESPGLSFIITGNDLIYAAGTLYRLTGEKGALRWAKHLALQYVTARHPETGLGVSQFTQPKNRMGREPEDDSITVSFYGDRAKRQFGAMVGEIALEGNILFDGNSLHGRTIYCENPLIELQLASESGSEADCFREWTKSGLLSFARYGYIPETNEVKPMFTDGKDLTGMVFKRGGYFGKVGTVFERVQAEVELLLAYSRAFLCAKDEELWKTARSMGRGHKLGDLGSVPGKDVKVDMDTHSDDAKALFAVLDLYRATNCELYLELAGVIGKNIEKSFFHRGYFTQGPKYVYSQFDAIEPLALLALEAASRGDFEAVPTYVGGRAYIHGGYEFPDGTMKVIKEGYIYSKQVD